MTLAIASPVPPPGMAGPSDDRVPTIVGELASTAHACPLAEELAARLGRDVVDVWDELVEAERAGWVETWADDPRGPSATLSPLSAARLDLVLSSDGSRWLRPGQRDPTAYEAPTCNVESGYSTGTGWELFDDLVDLQSLEGLDSLVLMEMVARRAAECEAGQSDARPAPVDGLKRMARAWGGFGTALDAAKLPRPTLILGLGPTWPVRMTEHGPCPGCGSKPLGIAALCLVCLRSGIDHLLPVVVPLPTGSGPEERTKSERTTRRKSR